MKYKNYLTNLFRPVLDKNNRNDFICMDKNEPPFSAFEVIDGLITDDDIKGLRIYPDPYELYEKLSKFVNVNLNQLLITHGSEQAIEFVFRVFLAESDEVVYLNPSFAMFDVFSFIQKAKVKYVNFNNDITLNLESILNAITEKTKLFVLANPNNPTGTAFDIVELEKIALHTKETNTIFLLDEAYFHFYDIDSIRLIDKYDNLIITRTFSKALGIAGARVGYTISNKHNITLLRKLKPIDEINQLSNIIAKKVIEHADIILEKNISQVKKWKKYFSSNEIKDIRYIETEGNFILLKSTNYELHKKVLLENKILPKYDFKQEYLADCIRFSILDDNTMNRVFKILKYSFQYSGWDEKNTIKFYTNNRNTYNDLYDSEKHFLNKDFISQINSVLDVGSSVGGFSNIFKELNQNISYAGIDVSKNAIDKANSIYGSNDIDFYHYDGVQIPLNQKFDLVFCSGVMHLIDNYEDIFAQILANAEKYLLLDFRVTSTQSYQGKFYFDFEGKTNQNYTKYYVLNFNELIDFFKSFKNICEVIIYGYKGLASQMSEGIDEVYFLFFKIKLSEENSFKIIFDNDELSNTFQLKGE